MKVKKFPCPWPPCCGQISSKSGLEAWAPHSPGNLGRGPKTNGARKSPQSTWWHGLGTWVCEVTGSLWDGTDGDEQGSEGLCPGEG